MHVEQYHLEMARRNIDFLTDYRTEVEVAGVQLIHLPFWHATYVYRPRTALRHFYRPKEKHVILEGHGNGVLTGELPIRHRDKLWVNTFVCGLAALVLFLLGVVWHPAFLLVSLFAAMVAGGSAYVAMVRTQEPEELQALSADNGRTRKDLARAS